MKVKELRNIDANHTRLYNVLIRGVDNDLRRTEGLTISDREKGMKIFKNLPLHCVVNLYTKNDLMHMRGMGENIYDVLLKEAQC